MEFDVPTTAAAFVALIAIGTAGMIVSDMMVTETILMMVTPSMAAFGLLMLLIGVKHGEYRASN
ncbi:DUF7333 family protein [Natronobacterium gregoryi]|uniref:Uncharacterized protein n=2 Tax=Natronobacterium gregoryi TaxID=44930 RepID=L0ALQ9_NATGS|nr:hypothetical protein [Natronobacterium gregoryi]AFZ74726.1 hypothetical protein Natgr_3613 [Natronobacterium gregoryi SP2]ELY73467.1 hypothetical protein C490_01340 [Natronobacterium gregoryi SP2]PLK20969.1 hypothetical protein CYV19_06830 [Natronobacterium gregoryi SP2]SFJ03980.1 hypothetical protein SAMN05443661_11231 [Natronobacterium gregoryi]